MAVHSYCALCMVFLRPCHDPVPLVARPLISVDYLREGGQSTAPRYAVLAGISEFSVARWLALAGHIVI
jgi:hypothetical protein